MWVWQTGAVQKSRTFSIFAAMHTSAAHARVKRTLCEWALSDKNEHLFRALGICQSTEERFLRLCWDLSPEEWSCSGSLLQMSTRCLLK